MKSLIHKLFCYLMAGIVFVSSTGFGLVEHSCLMSEKKAAALMVAPKKSCCASRKIASSVLTPVKKSTVQKDICCKEKKAYLHVDVSSSLVQLLTKVLLGVCVLVKNSVAFLLQVLTEAVRTVFTASFSPPLSGRDILILLRTLLI